MIASLLVSWSDEHASREALAASRRAAQALAAEVGRPVFDVPVGSCERLVLASSSDASVDLHHDVASGELAVVTSTTAYTTDGRRVDARSLAQGACVDVVPPFSAWWRHGHDRAVHAITDPCGLAPLYTWHGPGWAALATSSVLLAAAVGIDVDEEAAASFAVFGHHVGDQTWFRGVRKLQGGEWARLQHGRLTVVTVDARDEPAHHGESVGGDVVLRRAVSLAMDLHPEAGIELSGGMDCRAVLAAVTPSRRAGMSAITLGPPGSPDVTIAGRLAQRCALRHQIIDTSGLAQLDPGAALQLANAAGRRRDFGRDATGAAVLDWVEERTGQEPRFTGQGGELLRGHYYPGQPTRPGPTAPLVDRLASWRLFTGGAADVELFHPEFLEAARRDTLRRIHATLDGFTGDWHAACDELYLRIRMQRWAGCEYAARAVRRPVLAPYFHADVLAWGRRTPASAKADGKALNALTVALDPGLAALRLDTGLRPADLADPGWGTRAMLGAAAGRKALAKVRRRLGGQGRAPVGASLVAERVVRAWADTPGALTRVTALRFMDADVVSDVARGRRRVSAAGVAFLIGLDGALTAVGG